MTSHLITGIGELVTNDPDAATGSAPPTRPWSSRTAGSPGSARPPGARPPTRRSTRRPGGDPRLRRQPQPTWCSPATGPRSSRPGWPASPTPAAASAPRSRRPGPRPTSSCAQRRPAGRRVRRQGTTTIEIKSGYGLTVDDEARSLRSPGSSPTRPPSSARTWCRPSTPATRRRTSTWSAARCSAAAPYARWVDVFCERGAFDADQSRAVLTAGEAAGLGCRVHANQLGPGPGVRLAVELGGRASTTAPT